MALSVNASKAATGDTTTVNLITYDSLNAYGNHIYYNIPLVNSNKTYRKILLQYTIGKYVCPGNPQYCGSWDYDLHFYVQHLTGADSANKYEIARMITPYATTSTYFPNTWTHTYYADVTDYVQLFKDSINLNAFFSGYSYGFSLNTQLLFIEGTPPRDVVGLDMLYANGGKYGDSVSIETNTLPALNKQYNAPATNADMVLYITGHGGNSDDGCGEFCSKYYEILVNGTTIAHNDVWKTCGYNAIPAQTGTWVYDRAGWCPGEKVDSRRQALTGTTPGTSFGLDLNMEPYFHPGSNGAYENIQAQMISYKDNNFARDAELLDIISPSQKDDYITLQPSCMGPQIIVKNVGKNDLTSVSLMYGIEGGILNSYTTLVSLKFNESTTLTLPLMPNPSTIADSSKFICYITQSNGVNETHTWNDTMRSIFKQVPNLPNNFVVDFTTNTANIGGIAETHWKLTDEGGNTIFERKNCSISTNYKDTLQINNGCYRMEVFDDGGDGLNWWAVSAGTGIFRFRNGAGSIINDNTAKLTRLYHGGDFGSGFVYNFKTSDYALGLNNLDKNMLVEVYPNPANDFINITTTNIPENTLVNIVSVDGKIMESYTTTIQNSNKVISLSTYSNGIYFVEFKGKNFQQVKKFNVLK